MECYKWVVTVDGKTYAIERTFGGEPAIYVYDRSDKTHIERTDDERLVGNANPIGGDRVLIVAKFLEIQQAKKIEV